jgi:hypothetical protein
MDGFSLEGIGASFSLKHPKRFGTRGIKTEGGNKISQEGNMEVTTGFLYPSLF